MDRAFGPKSGAVARKHHGEQGKCSSVLARKMAGCRLFGQGIKAYARCAVEYWRGYARLRRAYRESFVHARLSWMQNES